MTDLPIPVASYIATLTMNWIDVGDWAATGNAVIEVTGGSGVINIPIAQGVRGLSTFAGTTVPTSTVPTTAVTDDLYVYGGAGSGGVITGDVLRKAGDLTWSVVGTVRGTQGIKGDTGLTGATGGTTPPAMTGATAATRYVGGTTSGAPVTGTFAVGDFVIAQDGWVWVCTGPGTPGTWASASNKSRGVIARAIRTTAPANTGATASATAVRLLSLTAIPVIAGRSYKVTSPCLAMYCAGGGAGPTIAQAELKFTTDGSTPTAASPLLVADSLWVDNMGHSAALTLEANYVPTVTGTLGLVLDFYIPILGGATSVGIAASSWQPITIVVTDLGVDPGDTGTIY